MFSKTARYYDQIYSFKNYAVEAGKIRSLIRKEHPGARSILDVACGSAEHARLLATDFAVDGIDLEPESIEIARNKVPQGTFSIGDMRSFALGKKYDVVQCLYSSIGYLTEGHEIVQALECFARHSADGGIIIVEPWFTPDTWQVGNLDLKVVDLPDLKICRMGVGGRQGNLSVFQLHYLIATPNGVEYVCEDHELALFTIAEMLGFFDRAGLTVEYDAEGISGRGLYIARLA